MCNQFEISGFDLVVKYKKVFTQNLEKKSFHILSFFGWHFWGANHTFVLSLQVSDS